MNEPQSTKFSQDKSECISQPLDFFAFVTKQIHAVGQTYFINPQTTWTNALLGIFLVSVPVFFEAPLVRLWPWVSLFLSIPWFWFSDRLTRNSQTQFIGNLLYGFSWSWLAGAVYWGWFRWEPLWHLPVESVGLPMALWGLIYGRSKVGHCFYLGSLLGTAVTDLYFYWMNLMPYWRKLMVSAPNQAFDIVRSAFGQVQTPAGAIAAATCALVLLTLTWISWRSTHRHSWVFSGTLLGTLLVDSLFVGLAGF